MNLFGILSDRPFMARTAPLLRLGNSELSSPSCKPDDSDSREEKHQGKPLARKVR